MATKTIQPAGGNWSEEATWGGAIPTASDDVVATAESGNLTLSGATAAVCRSMNLTGYTKTFKWEGTSTLTIGTSTAQAESIALKWPAAGWTYEQTSSGALTFSSTSATELTIDSNGKEIKSNVSFTTAGKWKLLSEFKVKSTNTLTLTKGTLNTNGQAVSTGIFNSSNSNTRELILGTSVVSLTGNNAVVWELTTTTGLTLSAASSTIRITETGANNKRFAGGGKTYGTLEISGGGTGLVKIGESDSNTFSTIKINRPKTVLFGKEQTQTVSAFEATGAAGELITIESFEAGKAATLKKTSGTVTCDYLKLKDSHATGGATFYAGAHSENISGNEGWKFEAAPGESTGPPVGSLALMGVGR